jgi:DNA-binding beta-propeller fold protein YncE
VSDGERGCIWRIVSDESEPVIVVENLNTPSAIAFAPDETLIIAETGAHAIKRFDLRSNQLTTIAGIEGRAGHVDGRASEALFNAPIGLTVAGDGKVYIADTYNDSIRVIDVSQNAVRTLAGRSGEPGYADAETGSNARFDTPCGIALDPVGVLLITDTGNNRLRRIELSGAVTTFAGTGETATRDGSLFDAAFDEPIGITFGSEGRIYVADAGSAAVREIILGENPTVRTLSGGARRGISDGALGSAQFDYPSSVAVFSDGALAVADAGNRFVRAIVGERRTRGEIVSREAIARRQISVGQFRAGGVARWPFDPPEATREIAATFGEIRGQLKEDETTEAWFHNGLDIAGTFGETVRAVRDERVLRPSIVSSVGTGRERIRFPSIGYVHLRVGRDRDNRPMDERFIITYDETGRVARVRVRRGTRFAAGDPVGTLNEQYHVHLIAGRSGTEWNALAALDLPGAQDNIQPTIEEVMLINWAGENLMRTNGRGNQGNGSRTENQTPTVRGEIRIVVRAHDRMNGNPERRRLGLYRLGYQILNHDASPMVNFPEPRMTISFETLPEDASSVHLVYAPPSRSGYTPDTIFDYIVTNRVAERQAAEDFWNASALQPGDYIVRIIAEDFFGNRQTRDIPVRVSEM